MVDSLKQIHTLGTKIHTNKIQYHYSLSAIMTDNSFFFRVQWQHRKWFYNHQTPSGEQSNSGDKKSYIRAVQNLTGFISLYITGTHKQYKTQWFPCVVY